MSLVLCCFRPYMVICAGYHSHGELLSSNFVYYFHSIISYTKVDDFVGLLGQMSMPLLRNHCINYHNNQQKLQHQA